MADALDDDFDDASAIHDGSEHAEQEATLTSKQRRRRRERQRRAQKLDVAQATGITDPSKHFGQFPLDVQATYLAQILKRHAPKISSLEAAEYPLGQEHLLPVGSVWNSLSRQDAPIGLPAFLHAVLTKTTLLAVRRQYETSKNAMMGAPSLLIVTGDASRAAALSVDIRTARHPSGTAPQNGTTEDEDDDEEVQPASKRARLDDEPAASTSTAPTSEWNEAPKLIQAGRPAKLFGRHIKEHEQRAFLASHACPIAIGTPARLRILLKPPSGGGDHKGNKTAGKGGGGEGGLANKGDKATGILRTDNLEYVVLDITYRDARGRSLLESAESTRRDTLLLLADLWAARRARAARGDGNDDEDKEEGEEGRRRGGGAAKSGGATTKRKADDGAPQDGTEADGGPSTADEVERARRERVKALTKWIIMF